MSNGNAFPGSGPAPAEVTSNDRLFAGLAYIINLIVPLLILLMEENKKRAFQRYHAIQALGLLVACFAYAIVLGMAQCVLGIILSALRSGFLTSTLGCLFSLLGFVPLAVSLYYAYQAYTGKMFEIPVVTQFMRQQKWL